MTSVFLRKGPYNIVYNQIKGDLEMTVHNEDAHKVVQAFQSNLTSGLSETQVQKKRAQHGSCSGYGTFQSLRPYQTSPLISPEYRRDW